MRPQATHPSTQADNNRAARRRASPLRSMLLATSALASAALPTAVARATDATWLEAPANSNFNDGANWGFETPPMQGYRMFKSMSTRKLSSQAARLSLPRNEVFVSG